MQRELLLDLDGVLVDFVRGSMNYHQRFTPFMDVAWKFDQVLFPNGTHNEFWEPLGFDFWASLNWTPRGRELFGRLNVMSTPITIVTSPCATIGSAEGKIQWIKDNLPSSLHRRFAIAPNKTFAASPRTLLIDDMDGNVNKFREAGGHAILVPAPWNSRRSEVDFDGDYLPAQIISEVSEWLRS